jgi:hypothetical protein
MLRLSFLSRIAAVRCSQPLAATIKSSFKLIHGIDHTVRWPSLPTRLLCRSFSIGSFHLFAHPTSSNSSLLANEKAVQDLIEQGSSLLSTGAIDVAMDAYHQAFQMATSTNSRSMKALASTALFNMGNIHFQQGSDFTASCLCLYSIQPVVSFFT